MGKMNNVVKWFHNVSNTLLEIKKMTEALQEVMVEFNEGLGKLPQVKSAPKKVAFTKPEVKRFPTLSSAKSISLNFRGVSVQVYGGPYRSKPTLSFGVKMAAEIQMACDVDIPTEDFKTPKRPDLEFGLLQGLVLLASKERPLYVGCMGGIGRTGMYLALLKKIEQKMAGNYRGVQLLVDDLRKEFHPHAVETEEQMKYVADFDVDSVVATVIKAKLFS